MRKVGIILSSQFYQTYSFTHKAQHPFVNSDWLKQTLSTSPSNVKLLDCSWYMPNTHRSPLLDFQENGHIQGRSPDICFNIFVCHSAVTLTAHFY